MIRAQAAAVSAIPSSVRVQPVILGETAAPNFHRCSATDVEKVARSLRR